MRFPGIARWLVAVSAVGALTAAAAQAPRWLRRADAFRVRRVDVEGTRYTEPHRVLAASGIGREASIFDDPAPWRARILRLPLVTDVRIERRLPASLVIRVTEAEPVALARTPDLVPVDARGTVLNLGSGTDLDLPVLDVTARVGADGRLADPVAVGIAGTLDRIRTLEPALAAQISEARPAGGGGVLRLLRQPAFVALVGAVPTAASLEHLRAALADVVARGELPHLRAIDARFADQIVVAFDTPRR